MAGGIEPVVPEVKAGAIDSYTMTADGEEPTDEEKAKLRKVSDAIPWTAFLVAIIELCERFTYYGLSGVLQNYVSDHFSTASAILDRLQMALRR